MVAPMVVPVGQRLIDKENAVRTRPMRVLCLGMPRTGTSSLRDALVMLGFHPHHFREMMLDYERQIPLWTEALEAKFMGKSVPYGREEFDKLIGDYDCVEDNPSVLFGEDLIKAYPDAKVILTNRDVDAWAKSMKNTIFMARDSFVYRHFYRFHPLSRAWFPFSCLLSKIWYDDDQKNEEKVKGVFNKHYEEIRKVCPKERLLDLHFGDGWEPLCKFLDVPVPNTPWPHSNDSSVFQNRHIYAKRWLILLLLGVSTILFVMYYTFGEAKYLYGRDPETFKRYLKLMGVMSIGFACGGTLINRQNGIEHELYTARGGADTRAVKH